MKKKNEIIITIVPYEEDKKIIIRKEISNIFTEEEMTRVIAPFLKENIESVKIISPDDDFLLSGRPFLGCWNMVRLDLSKVKHLLEISHSMLDGCGGIRRVKYPRNW